MQQIMNHRELTAGFTGKQIKYGTFRIRQRKLRTVTYIAVMRRELPSAFFAERIYSVNNRINKTSRMLQTFSQNQYVKYRSPGKIHILKTDTVSRTAEIHIENRRDRYKRIINILLCFPDNIRLKIRIRRIPAVPVIRCGIWCKIIQVCRQFFKQFLK